MKHYLLSVVQPADGQPPAPDVLAGIMRDVEAFNDELRLGRTAEAAREYEAAIELAGSEAERAYLRRRLGQLGPGET
ncbi:hypothetical protein [Streptomyces collinus]|uniref:hypothetical protein n=1 Tax=Streptomyces collinus TaxID=42684 RepID=UPI00331CF286